MEDVNNLLNAGEVPNLFPLDEKQEICEKMRVLDRYKRLFVVITIDAEASRKEPLCANHNKAP